MSKRREIAKTAVQSQMKSLIALLQLYKEEFSKTPEDREKLQGLVDGAKDLETLYQEQTAPKGARSRP